MILFKHCYKHYQVARIKNKKFKEIAIKILQLGIIIIHKIIFKKAFGNI